MRPKILVRKDVRDMPMDVWIRLAPPAVPEDAPITTAAGMLFACWAIVIVLIAMAVVFMRGEAGICSRYPAADPAAGGAYRQRRHRPLPGSAAAA